MKAINFWSLLYAILLVCICTVIPSLLPEDILSKPGYLVSFTEFMAEMVPSIEILSKTVPEHMQQITKFYLACMWAYLPIGTTILAVVMRLARLDEIKRGIGIPTATITAIIKACVIGTLIYGGLCYFFYFWPIGIKSSRFFPIQDRINLGLSGGLILGLMLPVAFIITVANIGGTVILIFRRLKNLNRKDM